MLDRGVLDRGVLGPSGRTRRSWPLRDWERRGPDADWLASDPDCLASDADCLASDGDCLAPGGDWLGSDGDWSAAILVHLLGQLRLSGRSR